MKRYGLIGRTLKHSFSKDYFTEKFIAKGLAGYAYDNFELPAITSFPFLLQQHKDLKGVNVTIPYKEEVIQFLTGKNDIVTKIEACNCIKIDGENIVGYNTDVVGFRKSLEPELKPHHKKALILGTGGASKAIQFVLTQLGIEYCLVSRKKREGEFGYEDLGAAVLEKYHLIINTTPLGMYPNIDSDPAVPYEYINTKHFLFDVIYNPAKTKFLCEGEKQGAQIANGYQMLIEQAEESWRIWNE